ncbi:MAG: hypothetical protein QOE60_2381 [Thermoleophilaceae bacterium]|nr:hypothetical protein [Thermoleophilaceae bacterium]
MNADSGQGQLFRSYLTSAPAAYAMAFGSLAAFTVGAWQSNLAIMLGGPGAIVLGVTGTAWYFADRAAANSFYFEFASSVGLTYANQTSVMTMTPLLGAGNRRHVEQWMYGRLPGNLSGGVGQFVWERIQKDSDGTTSVKERNRFTICVVDLDPALPYFRGVYLHPRRGLFAPYSEWLGRTPVRTVEVESSQFVERYELRAASDQDDLLLHRLFSPTAVSWLANHPLSPGFELKAGTLCVFVPRPLDDAGNLTYLIDATRHLAERVGGEVSEEMARPA